MVQLVVRIFRLFRSPCGSDEEATVSIILGYSSLLDTVGKQVGDSYRRTARSREPSKQQQYKIVVVEIGLSLTVLVMMFSLVWKFEIMVPVSKWRKKRRPICFTLFDIRIHTYRTMQHSSPARESIKTVRAYVNVEWGICIGGSCIWGQLK
jgi:hypothetical protein